MTLLRVTTAYSDAVMTVPKWPFIHKKDVVRVTVGYSDIFPMSQGCHCNRLDLYKIRATIFVSYVLGMPF